MALAYLVDGRRVGTLEGRVRARDVVDKSKIAANHKGGTFIMGDYDLLWSGQMVNIDSDRCIFRTRIDERGGLQLGFIW